MKRLAIAAIAVAATVAGLLTLLKGEPTGSTAQPPGSTTGTHRQGPESSSAAAKYMAEVALARSRQDSQNPLASYVPKPGIAGRNELDRIFVEGFPRTEQSVRAVRALLKGRVSDDEKIALTRILGQLYSRDNTTGYNADILLDLRAMVSDNSKEVARSAALTFARLGYLPGSEALLKSAFDNKVLSANDYFGELTHMTPLAPSDVRDDMLTLVKSSSNAYAADILASSINEDPKLLAGYSARAVEEITQFLAKTEPRFASASGEFGLTDAVRYANWLRASAQLAGPANGSELDAAIVARLSVPGTDPRKIMAYLLTPEASSVLASAQLGAPAAGLVSASNQYAAQYPASKILQSVAHEIALNAGKPKSVAR